MSAYITGSATAAPAIFPAAINTHPSKDHRQDPTESSTFTEAVKFTLSPEAQKLPIKDEEDQKYSSAASKSETENQKPDPKSRPANSSELTPTEKRLVQKLKQTDREVKLHERQHLAMAAGYVKSGPVYEYITGPDGKRYATVGHVSLDISPVPNNPEATIRKAQIIRRAALAPADPSAADRAVAAAATKMELNARERLRMEQMKNRRPALAKERNSLFKAYTQNNLPVGQTLNILI